MPVKTNSKTVSGECEPYQLDLTDYVTGDMTFLTKEKQEQLFEHLRQCAECRQDFFDWDETFGVLVTEQHLARPATKEKMDNMIEQFKREAVKAMPVIELQPGEKVLNNDEDIGSAAVKIWHHLYGNGKIKVDDLKRKVKLPTNTFHQAVGWLARENQIHRVRVKKSTFVYLAPEETQKHQAQAQK